MNVFVSYQREDTFYAAHAVGYAVRGAGHGVFIDTGSIETGERFQEAIAEALSESNVLLAFIGPSFDAARLHEPAGVLAYEWRRARFHRVAVLPVLVDDARVPSTTELPPELRWFTRADACSLHRDSFSADVEKLVSLIPLLGANPRRAARVLWVDDKPANNEIERKMLRPSGIVFDNVVSTDEAIEQLANESYDLVITDLGRAHSSDRSQTAGATFLEHPVIREGGPPVIVYASHWAVRQRDELLRLGATEVTASRDDLIVMVLRTLGREADEPA